METLVIDLHPGYGAIPANGEVVEPGTILGLSIDSKLVVTAPVRGRVRILRESNPDGNRLAVELSEAVVSDTRPLNLSG